MRPLSTSAVTIGISACGLTAEGKYARKSLDRTRSQSTAIEKGKEAYLEIFANLKQGKTYFSITTKEGVAMPDAVEHRQKDVEKKAGKLSGDRLGVHDAFKQLKPTFSTGSTSSAEIRN